MIRKIEHIRGTAGYGYVKSGELSGDLCYVCGGFMIMNKTQHKDDKFVSDSRTGKKIWTVRCQDCGREVPFISYNHDASAYR